jgi:hypothetical protein
MSAITRLPAVTASARNHITPSRTLSVIAIELNKLSHGE